MATKEAIKDAFKEMEAEKPKAVYYRCDQCKAYPAIEPVKSDQESPTECLTELMDQLKQKKSKKSL